MDTHDPNELVTVEQAASLTGIPQRTLRNWVKAGQLPAMADRRPTLLLLADVAAAMTERQRPLVGRPMASRPMAEQTRTESGQQSTAVSPSARSDFEAVRDEWLAPLVAQIAEQAELIGRLRERQEAAEQRAIDAEAEALAAVAVAAEADSKRLGESAQADQLVNLLEDQVQELQRQLREREDTAEDRPQGVPVSQGHLGSRRASWLGRRSPGA